MKCFTEAGLMEKLVEAYQRGVVDAHMIKPFNAQGIEQIERRLLDMIHEDAGGHDGWGKRHG